MQHTWDLIKAGDTVVILQKKDISYKWVGEKAKVIRTEHSEELPYYWVTCECYGTPLLLTNREVRKV